LGNKEIQRKYGVIGRSLTHSFSPYYFSRKFRQEGIENISYSAFEIENLDEVLNLFNDPKIQGLNVTIPFKEQIIPFLASIDPLAERIGAVNVLCRTSEGWKGYNTDYYGFRHSLFPWYPNKRSHALILGTGGASKAIKQVLVDEDISFKSVSRHPGSGDLTYQELHEQSFWLEQVDLIINSTPLGTTPKIHEKPDIPYDRLTTKHFLYDLVYNPADTAFMQSGRYYGAHVKNGLDMLVLQAERSWEIWHNQQ
jgi:shikimate dehydrogenase